ncbi:hypothetical protein SSX86_032926 [Deinandra increscens subsp. villosa]|uniref:Dynein light chain n=1 Tax=Deinandra increscens subsp. villosa TaxID=3103831 RepID=A0AAP0C670_9ASTR
MTDEATMKAAIKDKLNDFSISLKGNHGVSSDRTRSFAGVKPPANPDDDRNTTVSRPSISSTSATRKVIIKSADMKEEMQTEAVNIAISAFENVSVEKDVAEQIKKEFDKNHGPTWHCIVGKNFGNVFILILNNLNSYQIML